MKRWKMPRWMEPYRDLLVNTGGNPVEDMMNGNASPLVNLPLSTLQAAVKSQVGLLYQLHESELLLTARDASPASAIKPQTQDRRESAQHKKP